MHRSPFFENPMLPRERRIALAYLPVHVFILPVLLTGYTIASGQALSPLFSETVHFVIGLIVLVYFLWGFLRRSFDTLLDGLSHSLMTVALGLVGTMMLSQLAAAAMLALDPEVLSPAEALTEGLSADMRGFLVLGAGAMPLVEETLFRGLVFGWARSKSRVLAYVLSVLAYVLYGVWRLFFTEPSALRIFVAALSYVPEALTLAWCYDRTASVWTPILLSALISVLAAIPFIA